MKMEGIMLAASPDVAEVQWRARCPLLSLCPDVAANPELSPTRAARGCPRSSTQSRLSVSQADVFRRRPHRRCRMERVYPRCCGLDVHKNSVWACARVDGKQSVETFGTSTGELLRLGDWLAGLGV